MKKVFYDQFKEESIVPEIHDGKIFKVKLGKVDIRKSNPHRLKLDAANPRFIESMKIAQEKGEMPNNPSEEQIREYLFKYEDVDALMEAIKANGGVIEPIKTNANGIPFDGYCRLAASQTLSEGDDRKFDFVPVKVYPPDFDEDFAQRATVYIHVAGQRPWQAVECGREMALLVSNERKLGRTIVEVAAKLRLSVKKVEVVIKAYEEYKKFRDIYGNKEKVGFAGFVRWVRAEPKIKSAKLPMADVRKWFFKMLNSNKWIDMQHIEAIADIYGDRKLRALMEDKDSAAAFSDLDLNVRRPNEDRVKRGAERLFTALSNFKRGDIEGLSNESAESRNRLIALRNLVEKGRDILESVDEMIVENKKLKKKAPEEALA